MKHYLRTFERGVRPVARDLNRTGYIARCSATLPPHILRVPLLPALHPHQLLRNRLRHQVLRLHHH